MSTRGVANGAVLVHRTMSLDGFIAGPDDEMDWIFEYPSPDGVDDVIEQTGAIIIGRRSYEVSRRDAGKPSAAPYGGAWSGPIFVLTHKPPDDPPDPAVTFLAGDVRAAVDAAKQAADAKKVEVFGADIATQCFESGLVDEILVHVAPILLGDGVRFVGTRGARKVHLEPIGSTQTGPLTTLRYRVLK